MEQKDWQVRHMRYVFMDIVQFTKGRTSDDQVVVVRALNNIVRRALLDLDVREEDQILLPTGDGMCVCLYSNESSPNDLHLRLAVRILGGVKEFSHSNDPLPQHGFIIRIGVDDHNDCIIKDINGNVNVAGVGISRCQRIMDKARGGNVLLSRKAYESLPDEQRASGHFSRWSFKTKHQDVLEAYVYTDPNVLGLNTAVPDDLSAIHDDQSVPAPLEEDFAFAIPTSGFTARDSFTQVEIGSDSTIEFVMSRLEPNQAYVFYFHFRTDLNEQGWIGFCTPPKYGRFWTDAERTDVITANKGPNREMSIWWLVKERWPEFKGKPVEINRLRIRGDDDNKSIVQVNVDLRRIRVI
ncbi:MAG: hypothetical protein IPM49_13485 [Flavobacteriales bacterium]|nr:hypothetical protein [Flavobacteriales bacterium]